MTHPLPPAETLTVEFKSDRKRLPDTELVEALVCLANTEGGELWLGVEDDGTPTGVHAKHRLLVGLAAARTSPSLTVQVDAVDLRGVPWARLQVPKAATEVAASGGVYLRRRLNTREPEANESGRSVMGAFGCLWMVVDGFGQSHPAREQA